MAYRPEEIRVGLTLKDGRRLGGLSDRSMPGQVSRIDNPDLLNVDFSERAYKKRLGYTKVSPLLKDGSMRLDGYNDYARFAYNAAYQPAVSTQMIYIGIGVVLRQIPTAAITIWSRGFGAAGSLFAKLTYDPTVGSGVWRCSVRDAAAGATRTYDIADGDLISEPRGRFRFIEWYGGRNQASVFKMTTDAGAVTTSGTTTAIQTFIASTEDFTAGIPMTAASTPDTTNFASITICEFRVGLGAVGGTLSALPLGVYNRELTPTEILTLAGYWKLNDGLTTNVLSDSTATANHGFIPNNSAAWSLSSTEVIGKSGLDFKGSTSFVWLRDTNGNNAKVFSASSPNVSRWTQRGLYTPKYPPGQTSGAMPDQCLCFYGTNQAMPSPLAIYVTGDKITATYNDGGVARTPSSAAFPTVQSLVGLRIRVAAWRGGAGTGTFYLAIAVPTGGGTVNYTTYVTSVACASAAPSLVSVDCALGRNLSSFAFPFTYPGTILGVATGACTGVLDDWQLVWTNTTQAGIQVGIGIGPYQFSTGGPMTEVFDWANLFSFVPHQTAWYMRMNEGSGNVLTVESAFGATGQYSGTLLPEEGDGGRWDIGLVDPYLPGEFTLLEPFDRILGDGTKRRSLLASIGCTVYDCNVDGSTANPIGVVYKPPNVTRWTSGQFGAIKILASENKRRPVYYDGAMIRDLGIRAPLTPPVVTLAGAGGTFANATYYVYYTFRNSHTAAESNPSPGVAITPAANGKIDVLTLSVSSDPQVDQRRIYITLAAGGDGAVAYLARTIEDNITTVYGSVGADSSDITGPPVSGTAISSTDGYFNRQEAPQASVVEVWEDYAWLGGNQLFPTRVFRNTNAGQMHGWDQDVYYRDVDQNEGNYITGFLPGIDRLFVDLQDGRSALYLTGDSSNPVSHEIIQKHHGMVGPIAKAGGSPQWYYLSEQDAYLTNGYQETNVSSPADPTLGSIEKTYREGLSASRRKAFGAALNRRRNQVWFTVTTSAGSRNDQILVYTGDQRNWSRYDVPMDCICEYEDSTDSPQLYGGTLGRVYRLDYGTWDGVVSALAGVLTGIGTSTTFTLSGTPLTGLDVAGLRMLVYQYSTNTVVSYAIQSNTSSTITVYGAISANNSGDIWAIGGIPFYFDFLWDFGDPTAKHRMNWLYLAGISDNANNYLRVSYQLNVNQRTWAYVGVTEEFRNWPTTAASMDLRVGGIGTCVRFRFAETGIASGVSSPQAVPSIAGSITITDVKIKAEHTDLSG